jgi:hypothetical protein
MNYKLSLGLNVHTWVAYDNYTQIVDIKGGQLSQLRSRGVEEKFLD